MFQSSLQQTVWSRSMRRLFILLLFTMTMLSQCLHCPTLKAMRKAHRLGRRCKKNKKNRLISSFSRQICGRNVRLHCKFCSLILRHKTWRLRRPQRLWMFDHHLSALEIHNLYFLTFILPISVTSRFNRTDDKQYVNLVHNLAIAATNPLVDLLP